MQQPLPRIPDATLKNLIAVFYTRVRKDPVIGPVFNDAITDWEAHLETLFLFWTSLLYGNTGYNGRPVPAHFKHREHMTPAAFTRWLELWAQTTDDLLPQEIAALLQDRAACIGTSFQRAMEFQGARWTRHLSAFPQQVSTKSESNRCGSAEKSRFHGAFRHTYQAV